MPLAPGARLGRYEILVPIGAGGMGEVYRAHDPRVGRDVAIKVSHEQFSERFEREARAVAALNHPNVCQLYDVGPNYLVMELIEGESLKGPLPLEDALRFATQIAEALCVAHEKGITHRDLKPANIMVTPAGVVKVLDFGLAKMPETPAEDGATVTMSPTLAGMILGTAAYMSPEQARGKPVDKRADIWAFGVVLYEMLTGKQLFHGETISDTLAAVLTKEPDWAHVPVKVRRVLERCLEKDPAKRLRDISGVALLLEEQPQETTSSRSWLGWAVAGIFILSTLGLAIVHFREAPPQEPSVRFQVPLPEKVTQPNFKASPDGRYIALTALQGGRGRLWIKALDSLELRELPGTENASYPFWAPDSASIGFFAQGKLKKIAVAGGPPVTLCDATDGRGGTWNRDGVIVFSPASGAALLRVSSNGGVPAPVTKLITPADIHRFPAFLPDDRHFLYTITGDKADTSGIYAASLDGGSPVRLQPDLSNAEYVPPAAPGRAGNLLFRRETTLMAEPFDPGKLSAIGELFPVAEQVADAPNRNNAAFSASLPGLLVYSASSQIANRELVWMDRSGKRSGTLGTTGQISTAALSPDDSKISYTLGNQNQSMDLWLMDVARGVPSRLTFRPGLSRDGVWSPNAGRIAFTSQSDPSTPGFRLYQKPTSGAGSEELLTGGEVHNATLDDWSMDGKWIVYSQQDPKTGWDLWLLPMQGDGQPISYLQTRFDELFAQFSPDGKWMAYVSNESGQTQVYVQSIPAGGAKWQVSAAGGTQPRWRRDGKELFYLSTDHKLTAVPVRVGSSFEAGRPEVLFEVQSASDTIIGRWTYQPAADGKRFLVTADVAGSAQMLTVVLNWQVGLKR
jgi:eukaryotic-like serine/threonine-protein kinase